MTKRIFDKAQLELIIKNASSKRNVFEKLNLHPTSANSYKTSALRKRLLKEQIFEHKCAICHLTTWNDLPIPLDLDHINGIPHDHRLGNLRVLCRNCHAQTPTFCGKNRFKKYSRSRQQYFEDVKDKFKQTQVDLIPLVINSNINFSKFGWVKKVSQLIGRKHQKVVPWMKRVMPEFYEKHCYKRTSSNETIQ